MPGDEKPTSTRFSNRPLYLQVRDALVKRITDNVWRPGVAIPNEPDLARELGVSPGTMRKALDLLASEHLVTRRQGRGTFVNDQTSNKLVLRFTNIRDRDGERIVDSVGSSDIGTGEATDLECARLRLQSHDPVYRIRRLRITKGRPYMVDETSMPATLFPGLAGKEPLSHRISVILGQYSILPGRAQERASVCKAATAVAAALGLASRSPIMVLDRVVFALDNAPVEWRVGYCHLVDEYYMAEMN
jgi:GntR family transcriptional regulator